MNEIIPCDECLVRVTCTKNYAISVTCPYLFYSIVNNQGKNKNIIDKVRRIEELFNAFFDGEEDYPRIRFTLYPKTDPAHSVVMYSIVT